MPTTDLKELRDCFSHDTTEWKPIRDEGTTDMRYVAGDPWSTTDRRDRENANRPCLSADELSQYTNQIINDVRMNKRAVKFSPVGNGANDQTAQFYGDKWREIEYRSQAQIGYTTAFQNAVERSYGFVRLNYRYPSAKAVHMDLYIDQVANPNLITPDPEAQRSDLADMTRCWVREAWDLDSFDRRWKAYQVKQHQPELMKVAPDWIKERSLFVGEYWQVRQTKKKLLVFAVPGQEPIALFKEELSQKPDGAQLLEEREVYAPKVIQQLTNGIEVLEETEWPGRFIPIVGCMGKIIYVEDSGSQKRQILSAVRLARDPQMLYAYLVTCEAEVVGSIPKFPYFVYEGQLAPAELDNLARSVSEPVPVIRVKPTVDAAPGTVLPPPSRNPYDASALAGIEMAKEAARRAIQAAMGQTPLPTAAQRRNEKSGVALQHIDQLGQRGSFHFVDHYLDMITQVGIIGEDLMDKIYDADRQVTVRKQNDTTENVWINSDREGAINTKGDHIVTVSTGPSFDSERDQASDFADTLVGSPLMQIVGPQKAPKILAQAIKLKNLGPIGDEIAEIIDPSLGQEGQPSPEQAAQMAQQLQGENQQLQQALGEAHQALQTKTIENQTKIQIATLQEQAETARNRENNEVKLAVAELSAKVERLSLFLEERARLGLQQDAHAHDLGMAQVAHAQQMAQAQQAAQVSAEQQAAQQGHDAAMAAQAQQQQGAAE